MQDVDVRSVVPINLNISLKVSGFSESVTEEASGEDLLENTSTFHTDVDRELFGKLPLESQSSSVSSLVTLAMRRWKLISGAPPSEFGEKTSVVINVTTRSGQGVTTPHGAVTASYESFGTAKEGEAASHPNTELMATAVVGTLAQFA